MKRIRHIMGFAILGIAIFSTSLSIAQPPVADNDAQVLGLARDMAHATDPEQWLANNKSKITPQIADAADELGKNDLKSGKMSTAYVILSFAMVAHLKLGDRGPALKSWFNASQARFMVADKPEQYASVRAIALETEKREHSINRPDLGFAAGALATDCSYFASKAEKGRERMKLCSSR